MDQPSVQERRKLKRRSLAYYMLVMDANTRVMIGHLVDITPDGLMMDSAKPLLLEKDFRLLLDTPDVADRDYIKFTARSKWCLPDAVEPYLFDIGFHIIDIAQHDAEIILKIMEKYAARESLDFNSR
jgi:hypothetical protein